MLVCVPVGDQAGALPGNGGCPEQPPFVFGNGLPTSRHRTTAQFTSTKIS